MLVFWVSSAKKCGYQFYFKMTASQCENGGIFE